MDAGPQKTRYHRHVKQGCPAILPPQVASTEAHLCLQHPPGGSGSSAGCTDPAADFAIQAGSRDTGSQCRPDRPQRHRPGNQGLEKIAGIQTYHRWRRKKQGFSGEAVRRRASGRQGIVSGLPERRLPSFTLLRRVRAAEPERRIWAYPDGIGLIPEKVVCSRISIFEELCPQDEVVFFELEQIPSLVQALQQAAGSPELGQKLYQRYLQAFSPEAFYERYHQIYQHT